MYGYNYYPQQPINYGSTQQGLKGRPVSSFEEVKAVPIDFDGSIFYFPDVANKRIYTKQIGIDGAASVLVYELKPIEAEKKPDYITREEFISALDELKKEKKPKEKTAADF